MFHRLHQRDITGTRTVRGLSCDEAGVHLGGCALVMPHAEKGRTVYRVRASEEINKILSAGYGGHVDGARYLPALERAADLMTQGQWGLAQVIVLQMDLRELTDDVALDRLLKADDLLRFNPNHKPAGPAGGQFTTSPSGGGRLSYDQIAKLVKENNRSKHFSDEAVISVIYKESRFQPRVVHPGGTAVGLMQIKPGSVTDVNLRSGLEQKYALEDRFDPARNIQIGTNLLDLKARSHPSDLDRALSAFGTGTAAYARAVRAGEVALKLKPADPMAALARVHGPL